MSMPANDEAVKTRSCDFDERAAGAATVSLFDSRLRVRRARCASLRHWNLSTEEQPRRAAGSEANVRRQLHSRYCGGCSVSPSPTELMRKRTIASLPAIVATLGAGCSEPTPPPEAPPLVEVATPLSERVADWDDYSGRFEPVDAVEVRPRVSGAIESVHFEDGQIVDAGPAAVRHRPAALCRGARAGEGGGRGRARAARQRRRGARSARKRSSATSSSAKRTPRCAQPRSCGAAASLAAAEAVRADRGR